MTLRSVEVRSDAGVILGTPPVGAPGSADYFIKDIDGLGPVDAVLSMSNFADYDGAVYHGSRLTQRNIVITLGYSPNYSTGRDVGALRKQAYLWFRPKSRVRLFFNDSDRERVYAIGYVEKVAPVIFSKEPEIQVSIICEDPYFARPSAITLNGTQSSSLDLSDYGDAPTGFDVTLTPAVNFSSITVDNGVTEPLVITYPFAPGDTVRLGFNPGSKYATVTRSGVVTPLFDRITSGSMQIFIDDRVTNFRILTNGGGSASYSLILRPKWLGV